jgi:hypothetical protein
MPKFLQTGLCVDKKLHGVVWNYYLKFIPEASQLSAVLTFLLREESGDTSS